MCSVDADTVKLAQHSEIREMPRIVFRQALTGLNGGFAFKVDNDAY